MGGVAKDSLWYFFDRNGRAINQKGIPDSKPYPFPDFPYKFVITPVKANNNKYFFKNEEGTIITDSVFTSYIPADIANCYKIVTINYKSGIIDKTGKIKVPIIYNGISLPKDTNNIQVFLNNEQKTINIKNEISPPLKYNGIYEPILFGDKQKFGFKNIKGNIIIPNLYSLATPFNKGKSWVSLNPYEHLLIRHYVNLF